MKIFVFFIGLVLLFSTSSYAGCFVGLVLRESPDWDAKILDEIWPLCDDVVYFDKTVVVNRGQGLVEAKGEEILGGMKLKAGERFEYDNLKVREKGRCRVFIRDNPPKEVKCYEFGDYENSFRVVHPGGEQRWYRILNENKEPSGWFLEGLGVHTPLLKSVSRKSK